jgi:(2Fe-2S) ferredoxin
MISRTHRNNRGLALWAKLLIGFFAFCMIVFLTICGVMGFFWYQAVNPDNIKKVIAEMAELGPLPADIDYTVGFDFPGFVRIAVLNEKQPGSDVMVLVGFQNKNQMSAKDYIQGFTGSNSFKSEETENKSKDELAAQKLKDKGNDKNKSKTKDKDSDADQSTSSTAKEETDKDSDKVSSSDPDDKTVEDLHKHTQSPRGTNLDVQKQGEITIAGVKTPYMMGQTVNSRSGDTSKQTSILVCATLSPDTNNIIMPVVVQNSSTFDMDKGQKFLNLIKAFKNPTSKASQ